MLAAASTIHKSQGRRTNSASLTLASERASTRAIRILFFSRFKDAYCFYCDPEPPLGRLIWVTGKDAQMALRKLISHELKLEHFAFKTIE
jgi:hypothetical protein